MKAFVAMFAAVASAAAEPWLGYGGVYGYGLPVVYGKSAPCVNAANQPVPCAHIGKREAEAEPWLGYGGVYGYGLPVVYGKSAPCVNAANQPVPCAAGHLYGKREAEAEPWLGYGGVYGYGLPLVYGKSAPCVNAANQPVPCAAGHLYGKREAEADPALLTYGLPAYTATVAATPLVHTVPAVYHYVPTIKKVAEPCQNEAGEAVPCAAGHPEYRHVHHVVSKREAEADPTLYFVNPVGHRYGHPHNGFGQELIHSSNLGICTNYLGQRVPGLGC